MVEAGPQGGSLQDNTITQNAVETGTETSLIEVSNANATLNQNNIFDNFATYALNYTGPDGSPGTTLEAENNWWGTTVDADIQATIFDWIDNTTRGIVDYQPFLTAPNPNAPASTCTLVLPGTEADLSITKSAAPNPVASGQSLTYAIEVNNLGPADATAITVTDILPHGVAYDPSLSAAFCNQVQLGEAECAVGDLTSGSIIGFAVVVTVGQSTARTICNTAEAVGNEPDLHTANDVATVCADAVLPGGPEADLTVTKTASPDPVAPGDDLTYTITVTNDGPDDATGVTVTDSLPPGVTFDPGSSTAGCVETMPGTVECNIGNLADGDSITVDIVVTP